MYDSCLITEDSYNTRSHLGRIVSTEPVKILKAGETYLRYGLVILYGNVKNMTVLSEYLSIILRPGNSLRIKKSITKQLDSKSSESGKLIRR